MIQMVIPWLPISSNHAYFNLPKGGRKLSTQGEKFKRETAAHIVKNYPAELKEMIPDTPFGIAVQFAFKVLQNRTWPETAKNRYKRIDVSNRLKLLEDAIAHSGGIDDSQFLTVILDKCEYEKEETRIWIWDMVQEPEGITDVIGRIRGL